MANDDNTDGAPPREIHVEEKKTNWLAWLALAAGLIALLFALSRCNRKEVVNTTGDNVVVTNTTTTTTDNSAAMAGNTSAANAGAATGTTAGVSGIGPFLKGTEAAPRTFAFERLNFATDSSVIPAAQMDEVNAIAADMKQYPNVKVKVVGYADASGAPSHNKNLSADRAAAVKAALVKAGVAADRIESGAGGASNPVATNATAGGRAENRRTEVIITQR